MKVRDLIKELEKLDQEKNIEIATTVVDSDEGQYNIFETIEKVESIEILKDRPFYIICGDNYEGRKQ